MISILLEDRQSLFHIWTEDEKAIENFCSLYKEYSNPYVQKRGVHGLIYFRENTLSYQMLKFFLDSLEVEYTMQLSTRYNGNTAVGTLFKLIQSANDYREQRRAYD